MRLNIELSNNGSHYVSYGVEPKNGTDGTTTLYTLEVPDKAFEMPQLKDFIDTKLKCPTCGALRNASGPISGEWLDILNKQDVNVSLINPLLVQFGIEVYNERWPDNSSPAYLTWRPLETNA